MQNRPEPDALLTPSEVAEMFRVNPKTVTRWPRAGTSLPSGRWAGTAGSGPLRSCGTWSTPRATRACSRLAVAAVTFDS
jgi:hypothetical protein